MDFTLKKYKSLLFALQRNGFSFITFEQYCQKYLKENPVHDDERFVILRHDVDLKPENSLQVAEIESSMKISATYYFRAVPQSYDEIIIKKIAALGHEIGYHYESLTTCSGDVDAAYRDFCKNLEILRNLAPISTICMHGSPRSPFDSKDIWKKYSYRDLEIIGEPYLDTDFSSVFYLTDTGRRWDGFNMSVRDKIPVYQDVWTKQGLVFHSADDIINAANESRLPDEMMITTHPQRWTNNIFSWTYELLLQNVKNPIKKILLNHQKTTIE